jgi:hypothetical protein
VGIALTPPAPKDKDLFLVRPIQISKETTSSCSLSLKDQGPDRDLDKDLLSGAPVPVLAHTRLTILGKVSPLETNVIQGQSLGRGPDQDMPPTTAVPTVRTAFGDELFATKRDAPPAAAA